MDKHRTVQQSNQYIDLRSNGRLFPSWILKNFKSYKLPEIIRKETEDPCNVTVKLELRKYQEFIGKYLGPGSPYDSILLYHGLGSGKTATSINLLNIMYQYDHNVNVIFLIKAALHDDPWMKELRVWLGRDPNEENVDDIKKLARYNRLFFCHYDSPYADTAFLEIMKKIDTGKPTLYIIDEVHNFIRNVHSNIVSKIGKRAQVIYDYILREKKENKNTRIVLISATPGINTPFELALMFNLLRPGIFPSSELEFNRTFVTESTYPILNPLKKNMFERRIMGLVSYYIGATPDLFAKQELKYVNLPMSAHQYSVYRTFEKIEAEVQRKASRYGKSSQLYRTYTRQACNFVFPNVSINITGELRPRPNKFHISNKLADQLEKGKIDAAKDKTAISAAVSKYLQSIEYFLTETHKYFQTIHDTDVKAGHTIFQDLETFKAGFTTVFGGKFLKFYKTSDKKSALLEELYQCGPKMTAIVFMLHVSPGKALVYSNYVIMEGIDMMKIYLQLIGFNDYTVAEKNMGYCEYHGRIPFPDRVKVKNMFNEKDNIYGTKCKVILLSPSATEGIQLYNIRQEHIMEPYWTEVRIQQVIGRGIRQCSHKDLPMVDRVVQVYRYKVVKPDELDPDDLVKYSTDEYVEDQAKAKDNLIQSFLGAMKEAAIDCELYRAHNMITQSYQCFKFPIDTIMTKNVGPAYKEDPKEDLKYDSGLHAKNARVERIKVIKINAVYLLNPENAAQPKYSKPDKYWYHAKIGMVYDFETYYPVGRVQFVNKLPNKLDKDTYIMSDLVMIPTVDLTQNL